MTNFKQFILNEKKALAVIFILFIILTIVSWNKWGYFSTLDNSDELLIPYFITRGLVLYKDIYFFYGPMVSYLLSILIYIFGLNLSIVYYLGLLTTLIYLFSLYILSRQVLSSLLASLVSILFLVQLAFYHTGALSYIFPYSFNAVLGGLFVIIIVILLINHYKTSNKLYLYSASIFCLLCLTVKQDFSISALLICSFYSVYYPLKKVDFTDLNSFIRTYKENFNVKPVLICIFIVVFGFIIFYYALSQYVGLSNLVDSMFSNQILGTHLAEFQEKEFFNSRFTFDNIINWIVYALSSFCFVLSAIGILYIVLKLCNKIKKPYIALLAVVLTIVFILDLVLNPISIILSSISFLVGNIEDIYAGINLWIILMLIYCIIKFRDDKHQLLIIICFASLAFSFRMFLCMKMYVYGFYYLPIALICFVYCVLDLMPKLLFCKNEGNRKIFISSGKLFIILMSFFYFVVLSSNYNNKTFKVNSPYGLYYALDKNDHAKELVLEKVSSYISSYSNPKDKILCYPIINQVYYYTKLLPANKYYYIMPDVIVSDSDKQELYKDIRQKKAKYIVISNDDYSFYGIGVLGSGKFYPELLGLIQENYYLKKKFFAKIENSKDLEVDIYLSK